MDIHIINLCANVEVVIGSLGKINKKIKKKKNGFPFEKLNSKMKVQIRNCSFYF